MLCQAKLASAGNELGLITVPIGSVWVFLLLELLLQRPSAPREPYLVVAIFVEPFAVGASWLLLAALYFTRFAVPIIS